MPKPKPKPKPKAPLTPEQRRQRERQVRELKRRLRIFSIYTACTLTVYAVIVGIIALIVTIKAHSFSKEEVLLPDVFIASPEQDRFSAKLKGDTHRQEDLRHNDAIYLEVDLLSVYTPVTEGGNHLLRTLHLNGESATFYLGSTTVCINGQYTSLSAPSILRDSRLCVPLDFFATCLQGVQLRTDPDDTSAEEGEPPRIILEQTGEIRFVLQENSSLDPIPYEVFLKEYNEYQNQNKKQ